MSEPRQTCRLCGRTVIVERDGRGFPPEIAASAWDRAVEAAAGAMVLAQSNGCCDQWPKPCALCDCFRDQSPDVMAGYERAHAHAALAAALPVLLEELAQRIEEIRDSREHFEHCSLTQAAGIVRGFAAEVTQ